MLVCGFVSLSLSLHSFSVTSPTGSREDQGALAVDLCVNRRTQHHGGHGVHPASTGSHQNGDPDRKQRPVHRHAPPGKGRKEIFEKEFASVSVKNRKGLPQ